MPRNLAIGDIHGCYDALRALCDVVQPSAADVLITLGDYVNRGPNSNAVIDWLIHFGKTRALRPLRGNHDIMMLNARESPAEYRKWIDAGGDATLRSYALFDGEAGRIEDIPDAHWRFLDELLPYHETDTHFFVHANACPDIPLTEQPDFMRYWEPWNDPPRHESGKIMVCGHTSQKSGLPLSNGHAVCIDTWACGTGWLSCLHVESGMIWQANQAGDTLTLHLDDLPREH
jgi:serine/threonine protein phosphatase 1